VWVPLKKRKRRKKRREKKVVSGKEFERAEVKSYTSENLTVSNE